MGRAVQSAPRRHGAAPANDASIQGKSSPLDHAADFLCRGRPAPHRRRGSRDSGQRQPRRTRLPWRASYSGVSGSHRTRPLAGGCRTDGTVGDRQHPAPRWQQRIRPQLGATCHGAGHREGPAFGNLLRESGSPRTHRPAGRVRGAGGACRLHRHHYRRLGPGRSRQHDAIRRRTGCIRHQSDRRRRTDWRRWSRSLSTMPPAWSRKGNCASPAAREKTCRRAASSIGTVSRASSLRTSTTAATCCRSATTRATRWHC